MNAGQVARIKAALAEARSGAPGVPLRAAPPTSAAWWRLALGHATATRKPPDFHLNFQVAGIGQRNRRLPRPGGGAGLRAGGVLDAFLGEGGLGRAVQLFLLRRR